MEVNLADGRLVVIRALTMMCLSLVRGAATVSLRAPRKDGEIKSPFGCCDAFRDFRDAQDERYGTMAICPMTSADRLLTSFALKRGIHFYFASIMFRTARKPWLIASIGAK